MRKLEEKIAGSLNALHVFVRLDLPVMNVIYVSVVVACVTISNSLPVVSHPKGYLRTFNASNTTKSCCASTPV